MTDITIDLYSDLDKNQVIDLILHIQTEEFGIPITLQDQPDLNEITSFYRVGNGNFWIARNMDKIIGTIALLDIGNQKGALRKMFVTREYRGREHGIAQRLLDHLVDWAKQKGMHEILLGTTEKFVAAQRFYEKNGFLEIPKRDLPKEFPVMDVDVKFYTLSLTNK